MNKHLKNFLVIPFMCVLLFGWLGPPIGSLGLTVPLMFREEGTVDPMGTILGAAFFSYIYGAIPAIVTGFVAGLLVTRLNATLFCLSCGIIGAICSFSFHVYGMHQYKSSLSYGLFYLHFENSIVPGFVGGTIVSMLLIYIVKMSNYAIKVTAE